jgi:hypothetical protein
MSSQVIYTELRTRYMTGWTPVITQYPNETFVKPGDVDPRTNTKVPMQIWARFTVDCGEEKQMDIGSEVKTFRTPGELIIQLFAPLNTGTFTIRGSAKSIADMFRNWYGNTVTCRESSIQDIGSDGFGWYQINVRIPFKTDVLH